MDPNRKLLLAILMQAIEDATIPSTTSHKSEAARERLKARVWLTKANPWFAELCTYLDLDPERARRKFTAYIQATDDNGGVPPKLDFTEMAAHPPAASVDAETMRRFNVRDVPNKRLRVGRKGTLLTHAGETRTISSWAAKLGISRTTISNRLAHGFPLDQVLQKESPFERVRAGGGSELPQYRGDRRGEVSARAAQIGVFQS